MAKTAKAWAPLAISLLALFASLGGVSWAGSLVSGKTIKKNSIPLNRLSTSARKALTGKQGPAGPQGVAGTPGLAGSQGPAGPIGPQGPFVDVVPSGKTLTGTYGVRFYATAASQEVLTAISFGFKFASAPIAHFVPLSTVPPAACPGNGLNPLATPGHLCVYETSQTNRATPVLFDVNFNVGASPFGTNVLVDAVAAGVSGTSGSWAVTAP